MQASKICVIALDVHVYVCVCVCVCCVCTMKVNRLGYTESLMFSLVIVYFPEEAKPINLR